MHLDLAQRQEICTPFGQRDGPHTRRLRRRLQLAALPVADHRLFPLVRGGTKLKLDDAQVQHLCRAEELVAKAYAEVLSAKLPVSSTSPAIMSSLSSVKGLLKALLQQSAEY
jgi:hypothetical protein